MLKHKHCNVWYPLFLHIILILILLLACLVQIVDLLLAHDALTHKHIVLAEQFVPRMATTRQIAFVQVRDADLLTGLNVRERHDAQRIVRFGKRGAGVGHAAVVDFTVIRKEARSFSIQKLDTGHCGDYSS